jgi:hypothetical protein
MFDHSNDLANRASNRTQIATVTYLSPKGVDNRGEVIMNRIQKAITAALALTITACGAAFVTAPMALADMQTVAFHQSTSVVYAPHDSSIRPQAPRHG